MRARSCAGSRTDRWRLFEATRYARGHKALYTLEINGEHASAFWDLHDLHRLQYFDHRDEGRVRGWRSVHITDGDHPYMKHWWVPGPADRLRAHVHPPVRRFRRGCGRRQVAAADVPRRARHRLRHRRGAEVGEDAAVGDGRQVISSTDSRRKSSQETGGKEKFCFQEKPPYLLALLLSSWGRRRSSRIRT